MNRYVDELAKMEINHIHRLSGVCILDELYTIKIRHSPGSGSVTMNQKFKDDITSIIVNLVKLDLIMYEDYNDSTDYYVVLTSVKRQRKRQTAGALFPLSHEPYMCNDILVHMTNKVKPEYLEPAIEYVKSSSATDYASLVAHHTKYGSPAFDYVIAMLTPATFGKHKSILLMHHLLSHTYAHNGIGAQDDFDKLFKMLQSQNFYTLETIHSICHLYDALYVLDSSTKVFRDMIQVLNSYVTQIDDDRELNCLMRFINKGAGNFLETQADGKYILPYIIKPEAMEDKTRQYSHRCSDLIQEFKEQICFARKQIPRKATVRLPNTK
jgi:hypothetical protein